MCVALHGLSSTCTGVLSILYCRCPNHCCALDLQCCCNSCVGCLCGKVRHALYGAAGTIEGDVRVSGHPKVQKTFARVMGYVEQSDIHSPNVSVPFPCCTLSSPYPLSQACTSAKACIVCMVCRHCSSLCPESGISPLRASCRSVSIA